MMRPRLLFPLKPLSLLSYRWVPECILHISTYVPVPQPSNKLHGLRYQKNILEFQTFHFTLSILPPPSGWHLESPSFYLKGLCFEILNKFFFINKSYLDSWVTLACRFDFVRIFSFWKRSLPAPSQTLLRNIRFHKVSRGLKNKTISVSIS